jgi:hypothetical protein
VIAALAAVFLTAVPAFACPSLTITASPATVTADSDTTLTISGTSNGNYAGAYIEVSSTGEKFSYTVDLTIDASTAATTFTPQAEFFESNGTNIGPQTGPVITVTQPQSRPRPDQPGRRR